MVQVTLRQEEINQYNTYLVVKIRIQNPSKLIGNPRLKPEALTLLKNRGWKEFIKTYGNEFMSGLITGGCYYGLIRISTTSKEEQTELVAKLTASTWGVEFKGKVESEFKKAVKGKDIRIDVMQRGGGASGDRIETTIDEMIVQATTFPDLVAKDPVPELGIFEEYRYAVDNLPSFPGGTDEEIQRQADILNELGREYLKYKDYRTNIRYVLEHLLDFTDYQVLNEQELDAKRNNLQKDFEECSKQIDEIVKLAKTCRESITSCKVPKKYYQLKEQLPTIEGQNMMLKKLEEEVANLRKAISVLANGDVGMGTPSPDRQLTLQRSGRRAYINVKAENGKEELLLGADQGGGVVSTMTNHDLQLRSGGNKTKMIIKANGNIGIGTTAPNHKFHVVAPDAVGLFESSGSQAYLRLSTAEGLDNRVEITNRPGGRFSVWTPGGHDQFNVTKEGNVGIGTTKPKAKLDVNGEIRGKLWYSDEYVLDVPSNGQTVYKKMLPSNKCAAFITSVRGEFEGRGEVVWVEIRADGFWYLCGRSHQDNVQVKARCIGMP